MEGPVLAHGRDPPPLSPPLARGERGRTLQHMLALLGAVRKSELGRGCSAAASAPPPPPFRPPSWGASRHVGTVPPPAWRPPCRLLNVGPSAVH